MVTLKATQPSHMKQQHLRIEEAADETKKSILAKLPGELRDIFYRFALVKPVPISVYWNGTRLRPVAPSLTKTSRSYGHEAAAIYYGDNTFHFTDSMFQPGVMRRFFALPHTGSRMAQQIKKAKVTHPFKIVVTAGQQSITCYTKITVVKRDDGLFARISMGVVPRSELKKHRLADTRVCSCTVKRLIDDYSVESMTQRLAELTMGGTEAEEAGEGEIAENPLPRMLQKYAALVEAYRPPSRIIICEECGRAKDV